MAGTSGHDVAEPTLRRPACSGRRACPHFQTLDFQMRGAERRAAHPKIPHLARRGASHGDETPASRRSTCGLQHRLPAMPGLRSALVYPGGPCGPLGHQRAPRTGAAVPPGRVSEAARERGCEPRARAPRQPVTDRSAICRRSTRRISSAPFGLLRHQDAS
jgi:hypothetical protein